MGPISNSPPTGRGPAGRLSGAARTGDAAWQAAPPSRHRRPAHHTALSASCGAPPRKRASGGPASETGLDTRQPSGLADETRAPPGPPSAHGARPRRRRHIREPAPESRPHRHGWRQGPEPVALAWDGARRRATRRAPADRTGGTGRAASGRGSRLTDHRHGGASASHAGCSRPATSSSPIWSSTHRRRPAGGRTRPAPLSRAPCRPSASCDAPSRKGASPPAPARSCGPAGGGSPDTARLCAADRVQAHPYGPVRDRGTRGDGAGRRGRTQARARRLVIERVFPWWRGQPPSASGIVKRPALWPLSVGPMALAGERHHGRRLTGDDVPAGRSV